MHSLRLTHLTLAVIWAVSSPCLAQRIDDRLPEHPLDVQTVFPHVVLGQIGAYTFQTEFLYANLAPEPARLEVTLYSADGTLPRLRRAGSESFNTGFTGRTVDGHESGDVSYNLAEPEFFSGWALIRSNRPLSITQKTTLVSPGDRISTVQLPGSPFKITSATVGLTSASIGRTSGRQIGVALVNPDPDLELRLTIDLLVRGFNDEKTPLATTEVLLGPRHKRAYLPQDLFGGQEGNLVRITPTEAGRSFAMTPMEASPHPNIDGWIVLGRAPRRDIAGDRIEVVDTDGPWDFPLRALARMSFLDFEVLSSTFGVLIDRPGEPARFFKGSQRDRLTGRVLFRDEEAGLLLLHHGELKAQSGVGGGHRHPLIVLGVLFGSGNFVRETVPGDQLDVGVLSDGRIEVFGFDISGNASFRSPGFKYVLIDPVAEEIVGRFGGTGFSNIPDPPWR